jgi:osmotically inducible lipoprotein OsmE
MDKPILVICIVLAALGGCANPIYDTYRNQPLVAQVENGMSKQQVLNIGGPPLSQSARTEAPGSCLDYELATTNLHQPYYVSLDATDKVDHKGFKTCAQWSAQERSDKASVSFGGGGGY